MGASLYKGRLCTFHNASSFLSYFGFFLQDLQSPIITMLSSFLRIFAFWSLLATSHAVSIPVTNGGLENFPLPGKLTVDYGESPSGLNASKWPHETYDRFVRPFPPAPFTYRWYLNHEYELRVRSYEPGDFSIALLHSVEAIRFDFIVNRMPRGAARAVVPPLHAITLTPPDHYSGHDFSHADVQITIHNTDNEPGSPYAWDDISSILYIIQQLQREYRNNHYAEIIPAESDRSGPTGRVLRRLSIQRRFRSAGAVSKA